MVRTVEPDDQSVSSECRLDSTLPLAQQILLLLPGAILVLGVEESVVKEVHTGMGMQQVEE